MNPIKNLAREIKTERLVLRQMDATEPNAKLFFDAIKNEQKSDFPYTPIAMDEKDILPANADEVLQIMRRSEKWTANIGVTYYIFYNNQIIGFTRAYYHPDNETLQIGEMWFVRSAWGNGFAREIYRKYDQIAFDILHANRITVQCATENTRSEKSIRKAGFFLDGISRCAYKFSDGRYANNMGWSKLKSEYEK
jgi:RimJ/RimL family protein N-acetyltransferase